MLVHGGWSLWSDWGSCSVSCDVGMQRRDRSCNNPYPARNGYHCFGDSRDDRICMSVACAGKYTNNVLYFVLIDVITIINNN